MRKNELMNLFGLTEQDFDRVVDSASSWIEQIVSEAMKNDKTNSYFTTKGFSYENGKLASKFEKEYVNGECVKDENYDAKNETPTPSCSHKASRMSNTIMSNTIKDLERKQNELKTECENYRKQIGEMAEYIDGLNDKMKKLELEKSKLNATIDNIKNALI